VIRQSVSCDICGTEKRQTNHWFVAREHGDELRLSGWGSRNRTLTGSKHLCGQTCLHKLVDEFMARSLSARAQAGAAEVVEAAPQTAAMDTSLTSAAAIPSFDPVAEPALPLAGAVALRPPAAMAAAPAVVPEFRAAESPVALLAAEARVSAPRSRRAEAWDRERERELRSAAPVGKH
jgi:hypothetical protein